MQNPVLNVACRNPQPPVDTVAMPQKIQSRRLQQGNSKTGIKKALSIPVGIFSIRLVDRAENTTI
jgi:hypothetical protein